MYALGSLLFLLGLLLGAVITGSLVTSIMVLWVRRHCCSCSIPCPCKDLMDHIMCGPHNVKLIKFCPYKLAKVCSCRWKDECKPFIGAVVFAEEVKHLEIVENEDDERNYESENDDFHSVADYKHAIGTRRGNSLEQKYPGFK